MTMVTSIRVLPELRFGGARDGPRLIGSEDRSEPSDRMEPSKSAPGLHTGGTRTRKRRSLGSNAVGVGECRPVLESRKLRGDSIHDVGGEDPFVKSAILRVPVWRGVDAPVIKGTVV